MKISLKNNIFTRFLLSYLLVWIIPIAIGSIAYYKAYDTIRQNAVTNTISMLRQSRVIIDGRLNEVQNMVEQIMISTNLNMLLNQNRYIYEYENLRRDLANYRIINNFIQAIDICFKDKNIVVSTDGITDKVDVFYKNDIKAMGLANQENYQAFLEQVFPGEFFIQPLPSKDTLPDTANSTITYISSFPRGSMESMGGDIIVNIQERQLHSLLSGVLQKNGWLYIADRQGKIITSLADNGVSIEKLPENFILDHGPEGSKLDVDGVIVSYVVSPGNGWVYVAGFPTKSIMAEVNDIRNFTFFIGAIILLSGVWIVFFMANRNSKPICGVIDMIKGSSGGESSQNAFKFLSGSVSELLKNNEQLKNEIKEKEPLLQSAFLDRLLRGGFNSLNGLNSTMYNAGINIQAARYAVVVIRIILDENDSYGTDRLLSKLNMAKLVTSRVINMLFSDKVLLHEVGKDRLAALFTFSFEEDMQIKNVINNIATEVHQHLLEKNSINTHFAAGLTYSSLFDVYRSFDEALQASEYKLTKKDDAVAWFLRPSCERNYWYYPVEIENRIINLVKAGDAEGVNLLLDGLYEENMVNRKIQEEMEAPLLSQMKSTFARLISQLQFEDGEFIRQMKDKLNSLDRLRIPEGAWEYIKGLYSLMCEEVNRNKNQYTLRLKNKILEYIHTSYMDQQLSRYSVASRFALSEVYLWKFFKEQTGENFSKYLENVRMEKARELISQTGLSINEIAERVGYSSAHAFRRAYKRVYGVIPSEGR